MKGVKEIEIRSEEVQDILSHIPTWMIRFGNSLILVLILIIISFTWLIKYPEVLSGEVILTTVNPPIKIPVKFSGKINTLFISDLEIVKQGDFLAEIENPTNNQSINYLDGIINTSETFLKEPETNLVFNDEGMVFGDIQIEYNNLKKHCHDYQNYLLNNFHRKKIDNLKKQVSFNTKLVLISSREIELASKELLNVTENYNVHKQLYTSKAISKVDFLSRQNEFVQHQQNFQRLKKQQINEQIAIADYERQLLILQEEATIRLTDFNDHINLSLSSIRNFINNWKQSYILSAPVSGKVNFLKPIDEMQSVSSNEVLFAVQPLNQKLTGKVKISSRGYGKIRIGQTVRIKLHDYPYHEYGYLMGKIDKLSLISTENTYRCEIAIDEKLITTYKKKLEFKPEMPGTAEVITEDLRLIERILYRFKSLFN